MGFLDSLFGKKCPACGAKGARVTPIETRCPNPACQYFDPSLGRQEQPAAQQPSQAAQSSVRGKSGFIPQEGVEIRYRNFQGQEKTFKAEKNSLRRRKNHILARVAPSGEYIALSRDRIQNLGEVDLVLPTAMRSGAPWPSGRERQVLNYHKKHGSTSSLYEQIRARFPDW